MFRIAICDESQMSTDELVAHLKVLAEEISLETTVDVYHGFRALLRAIEEQSYQLLYLAVACGGADGVEFAKSLRAAGCGADIVFLAEDPGAALEAYGAFPVGYVVRPVAKKKLRDSFRYVAEKYRQKPLIVLKGSEGGKISVGIEDILYIEVFRTELDVHSMEQVYVGNGSLVDTYNMLSPRQFYRSHRSFIVNLRYVTRIDRYQFTMTNGDKVAIAKNRYAEAKAAYRAFVNG